MPYLVGYATPYDYGAAGNGTTDDTTALQNAINGVSAAGGGTLFFPAGTFKISAALTLPNGVSLLGVGQNVSVINQTSTTANAITYNPSTLNYMSIENLSITGPGSGSGIGVLIEANSGSTNVNSCSFQDVTISGFGSHGFELVTGVGCSLNTVNVSSVGGHGIFLSGGTGNTLTNCFITGGASTQQGFQLTSVNYTTLNGCKAFSCGGGYTISGGSANAITGCGADTIVAANGQDGSGFKISGGTVHTIDSCYSNVNKAKAFYATGSTVAATIESIQENAPGAGATASIQVDSGSTAVVLESSTVTATSYAAGTTTVITGGTVTLVGPVTLQPTAAGNTILAGNVSGTDAFDRIRILGSGTVSIGPGTTNRDVQLARTAVGTLSVTNPLTAHAAVEILDGNLVVGGTAVLGDNGVGELQLTNITTAPTTNPTGGTVVYAVNGTSPLQRDTAGHLTNLAWADNPFQSNGLITWNFDPNVINSNYPVASGTINLHKIYLPTTATVSNVLVAVQAAGSGLTSGDNLIGLYNAAGTRVAVTADQTTTWGSTGVKTAAFTSSFTPAAPGVYFVAVLSVGTTPVTLYGSPGSGAVYNANTTGATLVHATGPTGQTTMPATITMSGLTSSSLSIWAGLS